MGQSNAWARCTAQKSSGHFCDAESLPEAPFPICLRHAAALVRYVSHVIGDVGAGEVRDELDLLRRFHIFGAVIDYEADIKPEPEKHYQVYYLELDGLIKIGYSTNVTRRLQEYPPMTRLLAVEPGGPEIETLRHQQFAHLRQFGPKCEWFEPDDGLRAHIAALATADAA